MAQRRTKGEGSLYFDEERSRWVGVADGGVDPETGRRRRVKVSAATKREATALLRARVAEVAAVGASPAVETVGELVALWLEREAPKTMSPRTLGLVRSLVSNHVTPTLGRTRLRDLRVEDVEALLADRAAAGLARSTLVKLHSYLAQAFDAGIRRRLVGWNPARVATIPSTGPAREGRALTAAETRRLLAACRGERLGAWVVVAASVGLRPGEVSGLCWDAVDLDGGTVVVSRSLAWTGGKPALKAPKTGRSRTLRLPEAALDALRDHRRAQVEERLLMGDRWPAAWADLCFVTSAGTPLDPANVRRVVAGIAAAAGIDGRVNPYDLRHSATSLLSAAGVAPELLADLLGHRDTRMVMRHYRHPVTPTVDVAAEHMGRALGA